MTGYPIGQTRAPDQVPRRSLSPRAEEESLRAEHPEVDVAQNGNHREGDGPATAKALASTVAALDRQLERGSLFTQAALQRGFLRIDETETLLLRLVELLAAKGVVAPEEIGFQADEAPEDHVAPAETDGSHDTGRPSPPDESSISWPSIALRVDGPDGGAEPDVEVDCAARLPICRAVCCRLSFPLSAEEVDAGQVKWDIGHPYLIRHEATGYCTHNDPTTGCCGVYADRPAVCRRYSCARDPRIWKDFEGMVLNQEWIDGHLDARDLRVAAVVPPMEVPVRLTSRPNRNGSGSEP